MRADWNAGKREIGSNCDGTASGQQNCEQGGTQFAKGTGRCNLCAGPVALCVGTMVGLEASGDKGLAEGDGSPSIAPTAQISLGSKGERQRSLLLVSYEGQQLLYQFI